MTKIALDRDQKVAFARIVSDLIEADFIVEEREMDFYENVISQNGITHKMLEEAKGKTLEMAVHTLKELNDVCRMDLMGCLRQLALTDGFCVPLEAAQIFAVEWAMKNDAQVYSVPTSDIRINNMTVIYIETGDNRSVSKRIESNYRAISNDFAMAGFDFVHIPHVVDDYKKMETEYLKKVVRYMIPSIAPENVDCICKDLQSMTTSRFCIDLLYRRLNIPLLDVGPSLLIKINESAVNGKSTQKDNGRINYANYLRVDIRENTIKQIRELIDSYHSLINCSITVNSLPRVHKFMYYGFHRSLFDVIAFGKEQKEYKLVIDFSEKFKIQAYFECLDDNHGQIPIQLTPQRLVLFVLIVKYSIINNGLEWGEHIEKEKEKAILDEFNFLYGRISGSKTYGYQDRSQISRINEFIGSQLCIVNRAQFKAINVKLDGKSFYRITAPKEKVQIKE